jgi:integrator complex subunit 11
MDITMSGAGQEVGKSCVVATIGGKRIMFDCGMHMGYSDLRAFPDFSLISPSTISCLVITHLYSFVLSLFSFCSL